MKWILALASVAPSVVTLSWTGFWFVGWMAPAIAANPDQVQQLLKTNQCAQCDLSGADLQNANLFGANLINANLKGANLSGANLGSANLTDADLSGATLTKTYFYQATLENTNFSQATLSGAYFKDAMFLNTNLSGANLQGVNLSRTNLVGTSLKGADLSGANLSYAALSGVRFPIGSREADLFAQIVGLSSVQYRRDCPDQNSPELENARQVGLDVGFADLSNTNLSGANLSHAVVFSGNLSGANLAGANLNRTVLVCSNLQNAVLDGADLKEARIDRAVLEGASLKNIKNADLEGAFQAAIERQAGPAQNEARQYVGSMNRAQQAYFLEKSQFSGDLEQLGLGIRPETEFYQYRVFPYRDRAKAVMVAGIPKRKGFKTYLGLVNADRRNSDTRTVLCESQEAKPLLPAVPTPPKVGAFACPTGFSRLF